MSYRKPKYIILRMSLIFLLVGIFVWSYILFWQNLDRVNLSEKMIEAILENKIELANKYAKQLGLANVNLKRTEAFLRDLQLENMQLKEKVKLLDRLNDLEREMGLLREENAKIHEIMLTSKAGSSSRVKEDFDSIEQGRSLLSQLKDKLAAVRERISFLRKKEHQKKIAYQQEIDQKKMLLGNNGYVLKDGQPMPMDMPKECALSNDVRIKVEFVK